MLAKEVPDKGDVCYLYYNGKLEGTMRFFNHFGFYIKIPGREGFSYIPINLKGDITTDNWRDLFKLSRGTLNVYQPRNRDDQKSINGRWELIYHDIYTEIRFRYKLDGKQKQHSIFFNAFNFLKNLTHDSK